MIDICITNLGKYNEGILDYERVALPTSPETVAEALEKIGIDGVEYEEWFLSDWESDTVPELYKIIGEYSNLEELNYLAVKLEELQDYELDIVNACLENHVSSITEIINLTENLDCYNLLTDVHSDSDLGYHYIEEAGIYDLESMGALKNYIDYEAFGRDIRMDGGSLTDYGYLEEMDSMTDIYTGIADMPDEYRLFSSVENTNIEHLKNTELDTEEGYSFIDGVRNNIKPATTRRSSPEACPAEREKDESKGKPSVLEGLKDGKETAAKHEATPKEHTTPSKNNGLDER